MGKDIPVRRNSVCMKHGEHVGDGEGKPKDPRHGEMNFILYLMGTQKIK